jgi:RNA polymerase sigma-70 factor, ECF subfamily
MATARTPGSEREEELVEAAREGDEGAYRSLVEPFRSELHAHCYRMLSSFQDAEDALQDTLLRAWRGLRTFEGRSSARAWLYRIATNACLDAMARRPKRVLPIDHGPPADRSEPPGAPLLESVWLEPYPDERLGLEDGRAGPEARYEQREGVELAFVAALQHLPPRQRAVLVMREVLGFSARETAGALATTTASVNSALQRARQAVDERLPARTQQATLRALGDARVREVAERYAEAMERSDVDAVVAMLTEDATWSMPPLPTWYRGTAAITRFLAEHALDVDWRHVPARANGQLAVGCYAWDAERRAHVGAVLDVLTLEEDGRIGAITAFGTADVFRALVGRSRSVPASALFRRFGLPEALPA